VPFSAQLDKSGLLSHGEDPPKADMLDLIEGGSWRTRVTDQLALAILQAKKNQLNWQQSVGFIRAMLLSAGIDSYQWIPVKNNY
ncbi:MAG: hypothetical protein JWM28_4345, partial [Chitinophagaceae bacterium]|nr:hypothetical protein [Chitinophagaceae bacterium]